MSLTLDALLSPLGIAAPNVALREMQLDSRAVQPGDLFLALPGHAVWQRHPRGARTASTAWGPPTWAPRT